MKIRKAVSLIAATLVAASLTSCLEAPSEETTKEDTTEYIEETTVPEITEPTFGCYASANVKMNDFCKNKGDLNLTSMVRPDAYFADDGRLYTLSDSGKRTESYFPGMDAVDYITVPEIKDIVFYIDSEGFVRNDLMASAPLEGKPVGFHSDLYIVGSFHPSIVTMDEEGKLYLSIFTDDANPEQPMLNEPLAVKVGDELYDGVEDFTDSCITVGGKKYCPYYTVGCSYCNDSFGPYCSMQGHTLILTVNTEDYPDNIKEIYDCDYRNHNIPYSRALAVYSEYGETDTLFAVNEDKTYELKLPEGYSVDDISDAFIRELERKVAAVFVQFSDGTFCDVRLSGDNGADLMKNEVLSDIGSHIVRSVCEAPRLDGSVYFTVFCDDCCAYEVVLDMNER